MIDKGFRVLKLVLLGIISIVIPLLFIVQAEKKEKDRDERAMDQHKMTQLELELIKLETELRHKNDIIQFYSDAMTSKGINDTLRKKIAMQTIVFDTVNHFIFDKPTKQLIIQFGIGSSQRIYDTIPLSDTVASYLKKLCRDYYLRMND